ncbi:MAG: diguanylate cyclase [Candidatus Riflebacteria bacterium]|nr:diguanylate cyclase [Candidatus Riflebacteria bacterium]
MGMQTKITLLLIFLGVLPAVILGYFAVKYQEDVLAANTQMHEGFSGLIKSEVARRIRAYRNLLGTAARLLPRDPLPPLACELVLRRILEQDAEHEQGLEGVTYYDRAKRAVASAVATGGKAPKPLEPAQLFTDVVLDTYGGSPTIVTTSPVDFGQGLPGIDSFPRDFVIDSSTHETQIKFLVYGDADEIRGALVASLTPDYLSRTLNQILADLTEISQKVDIYVLDKDDRRIAATQNAKYKDESFLTTALFATLAITDPQVSQRREVKLKTFYTPDWRVVLITRADAVESLRKTKTTWQRVILIGIMASIVLGLVFARNITSPLSRLVHSALAISQGDLSHAVDVQSTDEIGDLAATFELMRINLSRMQENLKDKINELATLHDVGKAISSTLNLSELLNLILDLVMKLMKADRGSIMLLDEEKQELRIAVAKGLPQEVIVKTRVKIGEKVSGYVLETGRPLLIQDPQKSPSFQRIKDSQIYQGSLISVPLIAKEKKLGVLNLCKTETYRLDEKDLEFCKALSNQAAIAIENARLYELAIKDEMTKLFVRRYFDQRLKDEVRRAKRYRTAVTVMLLDIDHFKSFNDTYGHASGDEVLCFLSRVMRESVRNVDIVSRYGGEEFAILCPEQNLKDALTPAERIRSSVEKTELVLQGKPVRCTVSIGVACYPQDAQRPDALMELADQALYFAKNNGRNQVRAFRNLPTVSAPGEGQRKGSE